MAEGPVVIPLALKGLRVLEHASGPVAIPLAPKGLRVLKHNLLVVCYTPSPLGEGLELLQYGLRASRYTFSCQGAKGPKVLPFGLSLDS